MSTLSRGLFRQKGTNKEHKVSFSELFFDLVFVYAITQTAHLLIHHFTPYGVFQGLLILLAVWWVWVFTTWVTNWLDPERIRVRLLLFGLMFLGMLLSIAIPESFGAHGLLFAIPYVLMQLGRTVFVCLHSRRHRPELHRDFLRMSLWFATSGALWITGALNEGVERTAFWALALGIEYLSAALSFRVPGLGHSDSRRWDISGAHMAERCGLLMIIALGESLLVTGNTFSQTTWDSATITGFVSAFVATIAMWWIYFSLSAERASERLNESDRTGHIGRLVYTYIHFLMILGVVVVAVADEMILAHAHSPANLGTLIAVISGPVIYLVGNILFKTLMFNSHPRSHYAGVIALLLLIPLSGQISSSTLGALTSIILVLVAVRETVVVLKTD